MQEASGSFVTPRKNFQFSTEQSPSHTVPDPRQSQWSHDPFFIVPYHSYFYNAALCTKVSFKHVKKKKNRTYKTGLSSAKLLMCCLISVAHVSLFATSLLVFIKHLRKINNNQKKKRRYFSYFAKHPNNTCFGKLVL